MTLTPLDIKRQQFARTFRGYAPAEVDAFAKQVAERVEALLDQQRAAEEKIRELEARLVHYERVEMALQEAITSARESATRTEAAASDRARATVEAAEARAVQITSDAERQRFEIRQAITQLSTRQAEVASRLRGFLLSELEVLAHFQGDDPVGFLQLRGSRAELVPSSEASADEGSGMDYTPTDESDEADPSSGEGHDETPEEPEAAPEPTAFDPAETTPAWPSAESALPEAEPRTESAAEPEPESLDEPVWPGVAAADPPSAPDTWAPLQPDPVPPEPASPIGWRESSAAPREPEPSDPPVPPSWSLRSLVTGDDEPSVAASDAERERIRRILDDLD